MTTVFTESNRIGNVVKWLAFPDTGYHFELVTVNVASAATLKVGTVLAKVAATGKYLVQDSSLASGAGLESAGVLLGTDINTPYAVCAAATDTKVLMLAHGPAHVGKAQLVFGAGTDTDAEKLAEYARLSALGIIPVDQI